MGAGPTAGSPPVPIGLVRPLREVGARYRASGEQNLRVAVVLIVAGVLVVGLASSPGTAGTDKRPCVSLPEYHQIKNGMTLAKVHRIFDMRGKVLFQNHGAVTNGAREYSSCSDSGLGATVQVQYNNYARHGGPFRVVRKQSY